MLYEYLSEAVEFLSSLNEKARIKIQYNANLARYELNSELFKKLNDNIWEFRTLYNGIAYRLFAFWDSESLKMTQEQLGEKIGVQKARICSIEKGANLRLSTLRRIFRALGLEVDINIKDRIVVHLC